MVGTAVSASAVLDVDVGVVHDGYFGILFHQPYGRGCRGGAKQDRDAGITKTVNDVMEPTEFKNTGRGLHPAPGKFGNACAGDACRLHLLNVVGGVNILPCFGVVSSAQKGFLIDFHRSLLFTVFKIAFIITFSHSFVK